MGSNDPKISQIQTNFQTLSTVASSLNTASDELTKVVGRLDEALKKLNVGLTVWVTFEDRLPHDDTRYDCDQIGYCKVNGKWGISVRQIWGDEPWLSDHQGENGPWLFNDAPREMRLRSVDKIAVLIEALSKEASNTTKRIQEKTQEVSELAAAIESAANEAKRKSPTLSERIAVRKANAGTVAVPGALPAGESPKAQEDSLANQVQKGFGKNIEGSK